MIETIPEVPVETVTPIKPSEAIRLGCLIAPVQAFQMFGWGDKACVTGAMNLGYGYPQDDEFGWTALPGSLLQGPCPVAHCAGGGKAAWKTVTYHLNDDHRWSRERIADWLAEQGL